MKKLVPGVNFVTNVEYHNDLTWLSSSSFKKVLENPNLFYKENILGEKTVEAPKEHLQDGSLTHTLILEPQLLLQEYSFFPGIRRTGVEWENFKNDPANKDKIIMTKSQKARAEYMYASYKLNKSAVALIEQGGHSEHTVCAEIDGVKMKVRADRINIEKGFIVDIKTSGWPVDIDSVRFTNEKWKYPFSAAMYKSVFENFYGREFDFYWIYIAKKEKDCAVYKMSTQTFEEGKFEWLRGVAAYKQCLKTGIWQKTEPVTHFEEEVIEI